MNEDILIAQNLLLAKLTQEVAALTDQVEISNKLKRQKIDNNQITHSSVELLHYRAAKLR